jgi:peroxiredoxin
MLKRIGIIFLVIIPLSVIAVLAFSNNETNQNPESPIKIAVKDFTLTDVYGKKHSLSDYNDSKAILVLFIATQCPVSNDYNSRMAELYKEYHEKDIAVLGINSNKQESVSECKEHAEKNGFGFPVLKDEKNVIADMFEASVTPEAYVLEPKTYTILYHGRIDDSRNESNVEVYDLDNALNEVLSGKKVSVSETKAFGCTRKRV